MDANGIIHIQDDDDDLESGNHYADSDRAAILTPAISQVVTALGGFEGNIYVLGDECYGCLKDLKKFWRKDDTDDDRTVARIFWNLRILPNDLIPILLETAGKGRVADKHAIAAADIVTAMTWPIDLAAELKELDEEDVKADYTHLLESHLYYKAALLRPGVISALFSILLPCIAKDKRERKERDTQIVNVILHLFRNLAFIRDKPPNAHLSADQAEFSSLQSTLVKTYAESHVLDLLITVASNASDSFFAQWNTLVLETLYLLYRGVLPGSIAMDQVKRSQSTLSQLLAAESKLHVENKRTASSRHSRFGTTIAVTLNPNKVRANGGGDAEDHMESDTNAQKIILHRQQGIKDQAGTVLDLKKRRKFLKANKEDELGLQDNLDVDAKTVLQGTAKTFIQACFNTFLGSLLKDIKSERAKITEKDHVRLLFVTRWFIEFFLALREQSAKKSNTATKANEKVKTTGEKWEFEMIGEVVDRGWIVWILKRMREAVEQKPKAWTELQAGIECLTQLLALIDAMSHPTVSDELSDDNPDLAEAAETLRQQIVYNGEVLDISVDALRAYKEGVQTLRYLDASVRLGYALLRMLEKWSRERAGGEFLVRKKKAKRRKRRGNEDDEESGMQAEPESDEKIIEQETIFTFDSFEARFANAEVTQTLLKYLSRYESFTSPEQMKRVVNLLHRQAVKSKAEGLFFNVSTLRLFKAILGRKDSLPKEQPYKDLVALVGYVVRKFFKTVEEDPFVLVEAFYPKNRNRWKQFSSWEPEEKESRRGRAASPSSKIPAEVKVKKGYSWSQQLGIAVACLVDDGKRDLVEWVTEVLTMVVGMRMRIVEEVKEMGLEGPKRPGEVEGAGEEGEGEYGENGPVVKLPAAEAMAKFEDYTIPYETDEKADAATRNSYLKLIFRLVRFFVADDNADELEWYVPASVTPSELSACLRVITQFLTTPIDLSGTSPTSLLTKSRRRRRRRRSPSSPHPSASDSESGSEKKKRTKKKKKEQQVYKSAQFIEDSDMEYGDDEQFWEREKMQREKTERMAAEGRSAGMRKTGMKKRKKGKGPKMDDEAEGDDDDDGREGDEEDAGGVEGEGRAKRSRSTPPDDLDDGADEPFMRSRTSSDSDSEEDDEPLGLEDIVDKVTSAPSTSKVKAMSKRKTKGKEKEKTKPKPKPKPKPAYKKAREAAQASVFQAATSQSTTTEGVFENDKDGEEGEERQGSDAGLDVDMDEIQSRARKPKTKAIVLSDDED